MEKASLTEIEDYVATAYTLLSRAALEKDHLRGMNVWIGASRHEQTSRRMKELYSSALEELGVNILDCSFEAVLAKRIDCDILLMFTLTPGISARAIEVVVASKYHPPLGTIKDKLYVYMPREYSEGYISRKIEDNLVAGKFCQRDRILFDQLNTSIFSRCISHLIEVVNDQIEEMKVTFKPSILIVTALPLEFDMALSLLDNVRHDPTLGDEWLQYPHGIVGRKSVVVAMSGKGNNYSASVATRALHQYSSIKYIFMTGIAGGVPYLESAQEHVRLGDIVVCGGKGVVQHDMGKSVVNMDSGKPISDFEHSFVPRPPDATLLRNTEIYSTKVGTDPYKYWQYLDELSEQKGIERPKEADLRDTPWIEDSAIEQPPLPTGFDSSRPRVHFGVIASGNAVVKDASIRDKLKKDFRAKAIEMEASGVSDAAWMKGKNFFIVRGICDYSNPSKNDKWQPYAAAAAAAFTREIIEETLAS